MTYGGRGRGWIETRRGTQELADVVVFVVLTEIIIGI